jgi:hypothetical protein
MIIGTAAYMAPEQARGRIVDKRADVWAFGVVLYEMLTGQQAFRGEDVSDTLASVIKFDPDWSKLPATTPAPIRRLLKRCLAKDPGMRLRDCGSALLDIRDAQTGDPTDTSDTLHKGATRPRRSWLPLARLPLLPARWMGVALAPGSYQCPAHAPLQHHLARLRPPAGRCRPYCGHCAQRSRAGVSRSCVHNILHVQGRVLVNSTYRSSCPRAKASVSRT